MAVGATPPMEGQNCTLPIRHATTLHDPSSMLAPETALFFAIDLHFALQMMGAQGEAARPDKDEVTYFVNRDSQGWVVQTVRRRVYIELKLECTRCRFWDGHKSRDDWLCVYCRNSFPSKLQLTDHRVGGCPCGPVDRRGQKLELPVYPNLKTAKQGKDLKAALQRGERGQWDVLQDDSAWLDLNPELRDLTFPPLGARVHERRFMLPTIEELRASHVPARGWVQSQATPPPQQSPLRQPAQPSVSEFVDLGDEDDAEPTSRPKKRSHARMEEGQRVHVSARQFKPAPRRPEPAARKGCPQPGPPPEPIRVAPIQARSPSPQRMAILAPPSPVACAAPTPPLTPVPPAQSPRPDPDFATTMRKERQAFYVATSTSARASVKMDSPKPALRPQIQPPGLYHLMEFGLLKFDAELGEFHVFQDELEGWRSDPHFNDRLWLAYGKFQSPKHQVCGFHSVQFHLQKIGCACYQL